MDQGNNEFEPQQDHMPDSNGSAQANVEMQQLDDNQQDYSLNQQYQNNGQVNNGDVNQMQIQQQNFSNFYGDHIPQQQALITQPDSHTPIIPPYHFQRDQPVDDMEQDGDDNTQRSNTKQQDQPKPLTLEDLNDDDEGVIITSSVKQQSTTAQTPSQNKYRSSSDNLEGNASASTSRMSAAYHMQQNLQVSAQLTKSLFDTIKKGDIEAAKSESAKLGINLSNLQDDGYRQNAMFYAVQVKDEQLAIKMVQWLLTLGVEAPHQDSLQQTPLFYASRDGKIQLVDILLNQGCEPNQVDTNGQTAMFYAAREGQSEICKLLINAGGDADFVDQNLQTPLYYAVRGGKYETAELLIKKGANVNHEDKKQNTPMHIAKRSNKQQIMNLLSEHGARPLEELRKKNQAKINQNQQDKKLAKQNSELSIQTNTQSQQPLPPPVNNELSQPKQVQQVQPIPQVPPQTQVPKKQSVSGNPQERKQAKRYVLTVLKDGNWEPLSNEEMDKFEEQYPDIAKFWKDPVTLDGLQLPKFPENAPIYESWDKAAKRLISTLWKCNQAWIFHEPVDPEKLGIPDYFEVIKQPMDFGTIKNRLNTNYYHRLQEFLDDMQLVFENCMRFNGDDSQVGKMCRNVREEFKRLYDQLNLEFYLK